MPTPGEVFARLAARYGGVDPADAEAVEEWYRLEIPRLDRETLTRFFEELLATESEEGAEAPHRSLDDAPLPALADTPPANVPPVARIWRYRRKRT